MSSSVAVGRVVSKPISLAQVGVTTTLTMPLERPHALLPLRPLIGRHFVGAVPLEVLLGDAVHDIQLGTAADEQPLY